MSFIDSLRPAVMQPMHEFATSITSSSPYKIALGVTSLINLARVYTDPQLKERFSERQPDYLYGAATFLALGTVFLIENRFSALKSLLFLLLCIAIALFSNMLRVVFLIITGNLLGTQNVMEGSFSHDYSGFAVFIIGLIMMATTWKVIK